MEIICKLSNVNKAYKENKVISDFSMTVYKGEMVAIMGASGSGKTTILNMIGLLDRPNSGSVTLFDKDTSKITQMQTTKSFRSKLGFLFQNYALIENKSIMDNLSLSLIYSKKSRQEKKELMNQALKEVGLDIPLKRKVYTLSGGQQQCVAIARMMLKSFELVLADEPTGSLDEDNRDVVLSLLQKIKDTGKTIIIVTHDTTVANTCDRIIHLE